MQEILSKKEIADRLKTLRVQKQLSQEQIAREIGISRSNYSQIELGNQFPTYEALIKIAKYYSKSYDWILDGAEGDCHCGNRLETLVMNLEDQINKLSDAILYLNNEIEKLKGK